MHLQGVPRRRHLHLPKRLGFESCHEPSDVHISTTHWRRQTSPPTSQISHCDLSVSVSRASAWAGIARVCDPVQRPFPQRAFSPSHGLASRNLISSFHAPCVAHLLRPALHLNAHCVIPCVPANPPLCPYGLGRGREKHSGRLWLRRRSQPHPGLPRGGLTGALAEGAGEAGALEPRERAAQT